MALLITAPGVSRWAMVGLAVVLGLGAGWAWTSSIRVDEVSVAKRFLGWQRRLRLADVVSLTTEVEHGPSSISMATVRVRDDLGRSLVVRIAWWSGGRELAEVLRELQLAAAMASEGL